jgi:serine/threonine protein kinase
MSASPKDCLQGRTVGSGWTVLELLRKADGGTGGHFSTGYIVEKDKRKAFMKAMDITSALLEPPDKQLDAIRHAIDMIQFEGMLLQECESKRLSRVVRILEQGIENVGGSPADPISQAVSRVHVFIFELGGDDVRKAFGVPSATDSSARLRVLHNVTAAIQQLHAVGIAHQDVKPSNILAFPQEAHKLADLGRASMMGRAGPVDGFLFPGDWTYCPPEFAYGYTAPEYMDRRFGTDAYMLGSMICFMFTLQSATTLLQQALPPHMLPPRWHRDPTSSAWTGSFNEALPHLHQATARVREYVSRYFPDFCRDELGQAFAELVNPDPHERGHPRSKIAVGRLLGLDRYVSIFDRLSRRANIAQRSAA